MFKVEYRIVHSEEDDFVGQNGFFQISCNGYTYGEMYPKEIEGYMEREAIDDWLERLGRVIKYLDTEDYVALSDVESNNTWLVFQRRNESIVISIMKAIKKNNSRDIEFKLEGASDGKWGNQAVIYKQLKEEILLKTKEYIKYVSENNADSIVAEKIKKRFT